MLPEESAEFEQDVLSGAIVLPEGTALLSSERIPEVNPGVLEAYNNDVMTPEEKAIFEKDVAAGLWSMPKEEPEDIFSVEGIGFDPTAVAGLEEVTPRRVTAEADEVGLIERLRDPFTGELRETVETQSLRDWDMLPELNELNFNAAKTMFATFLSNPDETVQIIKANFPEITVRQDEKGNHILKSAIDGQEYALKPGLRLSDVPKVAAGMAAFTPAGRATTLAGQVGGAALTQTAIEAAQRGAGGEFDIEEVPIAGAGAGAGFIAGKLLAPGAGRVAGAAADIVPEGRIAGQALTSEQLAGTLRRAATKTVRGKKAIREALVAAAPDADTLAAARRLGVEEFLQPDHVTTNQAFREISQAVKSVPGSEARRAEIAGLQKIAAKADDIITELGGTLDLSGLDISTKQALSSIQEGLDKKSTALYATLKNKIKPKTPAPAKNTTDWIENRIDELGGLEFLSPTESTVYQKLLDKDGIPPSYALLDDTRKSLTAARVKRQGAFKDADTGLIKKLESELLKDQQAAAEAAGALDIFNTARQTVAIRKGVENDMKALFGRNLDGTILRSLTTGVKELSKGDASKFVKMIKAIPEDMREEVVASGLNTAFGKNARNGQLNFTSFARWYDGIRKNKQASNALFANLPKGAKQQLDDLYKISDGIRKATKERITTGRIVAVREELRGADNAVGQIYDIVRKEGALSLAAQAGPRGGPGRGIMSAIASILTRRKPDALKAADQLISSPEFIAAATDSKNINKLAKAGVFKRFAKFIRDPRIQSQPERWLMSIFQTARQLQGEQ
jgi:hypothetical protein